MYLANLNEQGICITIWEPGNRVVELTDTTIEIPDYDYSFLRSHYDRATGEWTLCPHPRFLWDTENKSFYDPTERFLEEQEAFRLSEGSATEEPPTEE